MAIHNLWLSPEITGGTPLEISNSTSREEIIDKLSGWKYHLSTPRQAFELISDTLPKWDIDGNTDTYLWILYVIWEYLRWNDEYNENNVDWYYHIQNAVNSARNRKGILSKQILQILDNPQETITVTRVDFKGLSQAITDFVVHTKSREDRRKLQTIKNVLLAKLWLSPQTDWTVILNTIQHMIEVEQNKTEAA